MFFWSFDLFTLIVGGVIVLASPLGHQHDQRL